MPQSHIKFLEGPPRHTAILGPVTVKAPARS